MKKKKPKKTFSNTAVSIYKEIINLNACTYRKNNNIDKNKNTIGLI